MSFYVIKYAKLCQKVLLDILVSLYGKRTKWLPLGSSGQQPI